jgi:hypothetical protein
MKFDISGMARYAPDLICQISIGNPDHDVRKYEPLALKGLNKKN